MKVHPIADLFPMMSDEEIADLAADIKKNDLLHPIIVAGDVLIDGRNRLKACQIANIEPEFEDLGDRDPVAVILSANIARRHLNSGQRALLVALAHPEGKQGKSQIGTSEVNKSDLQRARVIVKWCPAYVPEIIAGAQVFARAFEEADANRKSAAIVAEQMATLKLEAPDLHALVQQEDGQQGMTSGEAIAALEERKKKAAADLSEKERLEREEAERLKRERQQRTALLQGALTYFNPRGAKPKDFAARVFSEIDIALWPPGGSDASLEVWERAAETFRELVKIRKESGQ